MKYRFVARANPQKPEEVKQYAAPVNDGKITIEDLAKDIVGASSLSRGDVTSTIENMVDAMLKYLLMGKSVSLGELCTMRVSFSSVGVEHVKDFHVGLINGKKFVFTPGVALKKQLRDLHFELDGKKEDAEPGTGGTQTPDINNPPPDFE
ncbi:hypothetical protein FACS1894181_00600 [Bacteroidia bacterium]|nr:hypothetical protein FACS1894181_00600 [Bacteroidia bacterium]